MLSLIHILTAQQGKEIFPRDFRCNICLLRVTAVHKVRKAQAKSCLLYTSADRTEPDIGKELVPAVFVRIRIYHCSDNRIVAIGLTVARCV